MTYALTSLLDTIGDGIIESELTTKQKKLVRFAEKQGYVESTPIKGGFLINRTGRRP